LDIANIRVHDLKHTFGRRCRAAGGSLETRKVLLGHKNGDITSHYSVPEIDELLEAANRVCQQKSGNGFAEKKNRLAHYCQPIDLIVYFGRREQTRTADPLDVDQVL